MDSIIQIRFVLNGVLWIFGVELSEVIINNAIEMAAETEKLSDQINQLHGINCQSQLIFRNIILQIQDFDRYCMICAE